MTKQSLLFLIFPFLIFSQTYNNGEWSNKEHIPQTQENKNENIKKEKKEITRKKVTKIINDKKWFGDLILYDDSSSVWKPWSKDEINQSRALLKIKSDTMKIFNEYWSTTRLFPYKKKNLENLKDTIFIDLEASGKFFCSPSNRVNSPFGWRYRRQHKGVDTYGRTGDTLRSAFDGKVRFSGWNDGGYGHLVIIRHFNGLETYYAHCSKRIAEAGDIVRAGDVIALLGETGRADGPHLHFEMRYFDQAFDPQNVIDIENQKIKDKYKSVSENGEETYIYPITKKDFSYIKKNSSRKYHTIRKGETLGHLGQKYYGEAYSGGQKIKKLNKKVINWNSLQIGQKIRVR